MMFHYSLLFTIWIAGFILRLNYARGKPLKAIGCSGFYLRFQFTVGREKNVGYTFPNSVCKTFLLPFIKYP